MGIVVWANASDSAPDSPSGSSFPTFLCEVWVKGVFSSGCMGIVALANASGSAPDSPSGTSFSTFLCEVWIKGVFSLGCIGIVSWANASGSAPDSPSGTFPTFPCEIWVEGVVCWAGLSSNCIRVHSLLDAIGKQRTPQHANAAPRTTDNTTKRNIGQK